MKPFALMLTVAFCAAVVSPVAALPHPTIPQVFDALGKVHAIASVAISPDGAMLAYGESVQAKRGGTTVESQAIYVAPVGNAAAAKRVTGCPGAVCDDGADFAWSPDGKRLAFLTTDAAGQAELNVATVATGGVAHVTHGSHGPMTTPRWSPEGTRLAVLYTPGAPKAPGPLNPLGRDAGVLGSTYFEQRIAIVPAAGGPLRLVSPADLYVYEYDWAPSGKKFAVTAAHGSGDDNWWVADLYTIGLVDGATIKIHHPQRQITSPRWSGDGARIAYIGGLMSDEGITGGDVFTVPEYGGKATNVTPDRNASITTIAWNGSPTTITATYLQGGAMGVASIDANAKTFVSRYSAEETLFANSLDGFASGDVGVSVAKNGTTAVIRQSFTQAPEISVGSIGAWKPFTARNAAVPHVVTRARSITWTSDAFTPQGWLVYPDGYTPKKTYPMVVIVHGGPSFANQSTFPSGPSAFDAMLASQGYFVFEPNPRGSYGQGEAFTAANYRDFGYGDLRDILTGVDAAEKAVKIDDKRVGIFGWSYGGYMTMWALTQTHRFRAAVSGAGLSNWQSYYGTNNISTWMIPFFGKSVYADPAVYAKSSPITFITNVKTPTLLVAGDRDAEVPITQSYEYWNALKTLHVPTQFVVYPDEGHLFSKVPDQVDVATRLVGWFTTWMK